MAGRPDSFFESCQWDSVDFPRESLYPGIVGTNMSLGDDFNMAELTVEIAAYERMQADLESTNLGKWALVHDERLEGVFDSFETAAREAVKKFGRGPYLIRQIGAPSLVLPASVMYRIYNADSSVRVQ